MSIDLKNNAALPDQVLSKSQPAERAKVHRTPKIGSLEVVAGCDGGSKRRVIANDEKRLWRSIERLWQ